MGSHLFFVILALCVSSGFQSQEVPLKCFLKNNGVLNIFSTSSVPSGSHVVSGFDNNKADAISFNKDGWFHEATNVKYEGLKESVIDDIGFNFETNMSHIIFHSNMLFTYDYKSDGTLFLLPIKGEGTAKVAIANIQYGIIMPFDVIEENGNKYIQLKSFNSWYDPRGSAAFEFISRSRGSEDRALINELINKYWKYIVTRFGQVFMDKVAESVFNVLKNNMLTVPLKDFNNC